MGLELAMFKASLTLGEFVDNFDPFSLKVNRAYVTNLDLNPNKGQEGNSKYVLIHWVIRRSNLN